MGFAQTSEKQGHLFQLFPQNRVFILDPLLFGYSTYLGAKKSLSRDDLKSVYQEFFLKEGIQKAGVMAYSLGARFAMNLCLMMPERISFLQLFAPDGVLLNFWNRAIANTNIGRLIYKNLVQNQGRFNKALSLAESLRLTRPSLVKFARLHTRTVLDQERVLHLWILLKDVQPNFPAFVKIVEQNSIPLSFIFGKHDRVITERVRKKAKRLSPKSEFHLLDAGHDLLKEDVIREWIKSQKS